MKTGLVFSGGGSRGAYQLGVWKALEELNIKCDIVTGTSIGSINAALYVTGDIELGEKLWNELNFKMVFEEDFEYNSKKDALKLKIQYLKTIRAGGLKPTNLEEIIRKHLDIDKFYKSDIKYGLITLTFPKLDVVELTKPKIEKDKLVDYLIASSTVFPVFKVKEIDDKKYVDGGYKNSIPIDLALKLGADKIIAVDISAFGRGKKKFKDVDIIMIKPNNNIGDFLTFDAKQAKKNIKYGYNDTMKIFDKLHGKKYTFKDISYGYVKHYLNSENKLINVLEYLGKVFCLDDTKIYTVDSFNKHLFEKLNETKLVDKLGLKNILQHKKRIKYIYNTFILNDKKELKKFEKPFNRDYKAAYYLYINREV